MINTVSPPAHDGTCVTVAAVTADLRRHAPDGCSSFPASVPVLLAALARHDGATYIRSLRIARLAGCIARAVGCDQRRVERIWVLGLIHDIGMINVPRSALRRRSAPTAIDERMLMSHPLHGARMLAHDPVLAHLAPAVAAHHERPDGLGYPQRLRSPQIPLDAAFLAVIDALDTFLARPLMTETEVCNALKAGAGAAWDAANVAAVVRVLARPENRAVEAQPREWPRMAVLQPTRVMVMSALEFAHGEAG